jgi:hypothetical protein
MLLMRISLIFLLPACISLNTMATMETEDSISWLKYWTVLAFGLVIDFLLDKIDGEYFKLVKFFFVVWCLAPVYYNGSHVVFSFVLLPAHSLLHEVFITLSNLSPGFAKHSIELFISPVIETFKYFAYLIFELMPKLLLDICYGIIIFTLRMMENVMQILIAFPHKVVEFFMCEILQSIIPTFSSQCYKYAKDLVGMWKPEEMQEEAPSGAFDAIFNVFKNAIIKNTTAVKKERLFSKVLKDVIRKVPAKQEEPRLFSHVFKKFMYG